MQVRWYSVPVNLAKIDQVLDDCAQEIPLKAAVLLRQ